MKRPKLVSKWKDLPCRIDTKEYVYENGVRIIEAVNPSSIEFDVSIVIKAGAYFEPQVGVPRGTAHLLEHIIFGQPNKRHKSQQEIRSYQYGNRTRPSIYTNAKVSMRNTYFYGSTHFKGALRLLRTLRYKLDYPLAKVENYIEEERKVVLTELNGKLKEDRDEGLAADRYLYGSTYPELQPRVIGTEESINAITPADIRKFHSEMYKGKSVFITVQSKEKLSAEQWQEVNRIAQLFNPADVSYLIKHWSIPNRFRYQHFQETNNQSVFVSFSYLFPEELEVDYNRSVLRYLARKLIYKLIYDELRTEQQLIYSAYTINYDFNWHWRIQGYKLECRPENFVTAMDELYGLVTHSFKDFLGSEEGNSWFISTVSDYIFPSNENYKSNYAEALAVEALEGIDYKFDDRKANSAARKVSIDDLQKFMIASFVSKEPALWLVSPLENAEIDKLVKQTKWYKNHA